MKTDTIKIKIKTNQQRFTKKDKVIAEYILANPKSVSKMTINEIASQLSLADSTIFQFTRKLGYKSFRDFRNDLLFEEYDPEISVHENIKPDDSCIDMAKKVFESSIKSLKDTVTLLSEDNLKQASDLLLQSDTISFFGVGGSNIVSLNAYHKFLRSPLKVQYGTDYHIQLMQAALLNENDCAVIITHTGLTRETLEIAKIAKQNNAHIIAITSYPSKALKEVADIILTSVSEETGYRSESLSSRISQLAIIDSLFTIVMFDNENKSNESLYKIRNVINTTKSDK